MQELVLTTGERIQVTRIDLEDGNIRLETLIITTHEVNPNDPMDTNQYASSLTVSK